MRKASGRKVTNGATKALTNNQRISIVKHVKKRGGILIVSYEGLRID